MLGSHLDGLRSCLVDEDCTIFDARVGSACVDGFVLLSFFLKNKKECRHQHVHWVETGGIQDFASHSREGQAMLGGTRAQVESWRGKRAVTS